MGRRAASATASEPTSYIALGAAAHSREPPSGFFILRQCSDRPERVGPVHLPHRREAVVVLPDYVGLAVAVEVAGALDVPLGVGAVATTLSIFGALFITLLIAARPPR